MKTKVVLLLLMTYLMSVNVSAKGGDDAWRYDIECAGAGTDGTYLIKVWSYSKKATVPSDLMKKNAVHGVIFKGFGGAQGCTAQKPLAKSPSVEQEKADFFKIFFADKGDFLKYATLVSDIPETVKIGKNDFKVGIEISVSKDLLRKDLENAGIIRGLSSGF